MDESLGEIFTFYSFKGGTGRSMILANIGYLLSSLRYRNRRVLLMDWDLEAPGLERFFGSSNSSENGLIDFFSQIADRYSRSAPDEHLPESMARDPRAIELFRTSIESHPLEHFITRLQGERNLWIMTAGQAANRHTDAGKDYWKKARTFDWDNFYSRYGSFFTHFRELLMSKFDYVLIDSRTGYTDAGGICTRVMPEKLVLVFAPNHQNIEGVASVARESISYRINSRDPRPLIVFPVASRIDASASKLRTTWWHGGIARGEHVTGYQATFEELLREMYGLDSCDLGSYFDATQVPYDSDFSYGEAISAAIDGTDDRLGIGFACDQLTRRLIEGIAPWEFTRPRPTKLDFYVSHSGADRAWAEWVAWELDQAGYSVELDVWDWAPGKDFLAAANDALERSNRVVALVSSQYLEPDRYTTVEWTAALQQGRLVPLLVESVSTDQLPPELRSLVFAHLYGLDENQARRVLLKAVAGPQRPDAEPEFPGRPPQSERGEPRFPDGAPKV